MFVAARYFGRGDFITCRRVREPPRLGTHCRWQRTQDAPCMFASNTKGALLTIGFRSLLLILVENHSINHHVVPSAHVMDSHWDANFHFGPYDIFIEHFPAPRHVSDRLTKMVGSRAAAFLKHDGAARCVLRDRPVAFRRGRSRRSF
jgi:hypothetical protein